jgi:hypothetical protein
MACFLLLHNFIYAFAFTVVEDSADPLEHKQAGIAWQRRRLQEEQANSAVPRRKRACLISRYFVHMHKIC